MSGTPLPPDEGDDGEAIADVLCTEDCLGDACKGGGVVDDLVGEASRVRDCDVAAIFLEGVVGSAAEVVPEDIG